MRISFQHANPDAGNESFLLRFDSGGDETPCVLVDAGSGVDLDSLLESGDRLEAICLTHAHLDHYTELTAAHRNGVPVFTSPATAAILTDVFDIAATEYDVHASDAVDDAITPIDDWTEIATGVEIHPVPAGHAPGAVGFLVRVTDGDRNHHLLATGDFTRRSVAGFPGFDANGFVDVDALFLTAATDDDFERSLTEALGRALEYAHGGSRTLVTTSGLVGVQVASLLSALIDDHELRVPVRVVGHVAKLYAALEYDCPGVEAVPNFEHTDECLEAGAVTIAGPEVPHERSSGRLFGVLREDPNACVIQLVGSGEDPIDGGRCTVHDYELVNHPSRSTLRDVHDAIDPTETVIVHRHGGAEGAFNDFSSIVWGSGDTDEYTLFDGGPWQRPPRMNGGAVTGSSRRSLQQFAGADLLASFSVPSLERRDEPDPEAEGIDEDRITALLHRGPESASDPDVPDTADVSSGDTESGEIDSDGPITAEPGDKTTATARVDGAAAAAGVDETTATGAVSESAATAAVDETATTATVDGAATARGADGDTATETTDDTMATDQTGSDSTPRGTGLETDERRPVDGLVRTTGADIGDRLDPAVRRALKRGDLTRADLTAALDASERLARGNRSNDGNEAEAESDSESEGGGADGESDDANDGAVEGETDEDGEDSEGEATPSEERDRDESEADAETEPARDSDETEAIDTTAPGVESTTDRDGTVTDRDGTTDGNRIAGDPGSVSGQRDAMTLELDRLAVILVETCVRSRDDETADECDRSDGGIETATSVDEAIVAAVDEYITALLAGEASGTEDERFAVTVDASPAVEAALESIGDSGSGSPESSGSEATTDVAEGIASILGDRRTVAREVFGLAAYRNHVDAIERNEDYVFDETEAIVEAAIAWALRTD